MSAPRPAADPVMEAWIEEQMKHFKPGDLDNAVQLAPEEPDEQDAAGVHARSESLFRRGPQSRFQAGWSACHLRVNAVARR